MIIVATLATMKEVKSRDYKNSPQTRGVFF